MKHLMHCLGCLALTLILFASLVGPTSAAPIDPSYSSFGSLPGATFGGSGIPNDWVAIRTITDGGNTITLGLTAHERYTNPSLTNDTAGTFFATPGSTFEGPGPTEGARWNFAYYILITGGGTFADYMFDLFYDFDPGVNTEDSDHGVIHLNAAIVALGGSLGSFTTLEGSENLLFGYLAVSVPSVLDAPTGSFNPNSPGEYSFLLKASNTSGTELGRSAINVEVVPEPTTMALLTAGIAAMAGRRRGII